MLERNVQAAPPLAAVRDRELFEIARGGAPLGLAQYVALLKSAASTMDIKQSRLCRANIHEQSSDDTASAAAEDTSIDDMDAALAELEAHMSRQRVPGSSMNRETWQSLEKATHSAWDMISPDDKAKILNYAMERAERNRQAAAMHQRSANVTNMSSSDSTGDPETDSAESPSSEGSSDPVDMEANVNKVGKAHPGDVRRMMGKQPTKKSPSTSERRKLTSPCRHQPKNSSSTEKYLILLG